MDGWQVELGGVWVTMLNGSVLLCPLQHGGISPSLPLCPPASLTGCSQA